MIAVRIVVGVLGAIVVLRTLLSAIRTVVVPRAQKAWLTRFHFVMVLRVFRLFARPSQPFEERDRIMALYAPIALVLLPAVWLVLIITGFAGIYWAIHEETLGESFVLSGSSATTLGFLRPEHDWVTALSFLEAAIGLGVVALMISYLPTIYSAFARREALVGMLEVRAGSPASAGMLFARYESIGRLEWIEEDLFVRWEQWFTEVEESHTSQPALCFFRSPHPERSWVNAAGLVLDTAALRASAVDIPRDARTDLMIRTGFLALRRIADYFDMHYDPDPRPGDAISVTRPEFDAALVELEAAGLPLKADRDQAWIDFAGWRVNYDSVLLQLAQMVMAPPANWITDRGEQPRYVPPLTFPSIERARARRRERQQ
ncbi:MAG TPA: hypothetical protein VFD53_06105 [Ilumatobacter sp.]|nr:hypothetical protein [Ilumatobacter sp.]